jgi:hypothetical protein
MPTFVYRILFEEQVADWVYKKIAYLLDVEITITAKEE